MENHLRGSEKKNEKSRVELRRCNSLTLDMNRIFYTYWKAPIFNNQLQKSSIDYSFIHNLVNVFVAINIKRFFMVDQASEQHGDVEYIFRPYITVKGKRIVRKNGGMFKIPIKKK